VTGQAIIAAGITIGGFKWTGNFTSIDLLAATTNALNGALLGGIGGGVSRDVMLNKIPDAFLNPAYILLCLAAGVVGYLVAFTSGQLFREGLFQFMTSFSLPWYAIAGAQAAEKAHLPILGVLAMAVIGPTAGRWLIDVSSGVPPKQFVRGEWFVTIAALTGLIWVICDAAGLNGWWSAGISFVIGFTVRVIALYRAGKSRWPKSPPVSTSTPTVGRCSGRKLAGKSKRELSSAPRHSTGRSCSGISKALPGCSCPGEPGRTT
jgi:uncharacterized membrane protein YeiH